MQQLATNLAELAINANLYWAYTFFRYLTTSQQLLIIQMISLGSTTDLDGSAFMRQCQTNVAVLSLLDPSNRFAQEYIRVVQVFQLGNVLPTLFDFSGTDADDFVFDNQMLAQCVHFGSRIGEVSCPTKYFDDASSINFRRSVKYGIGVLTTTLQFALQRFGLARFRIFSPDGRRLEPGTPEYYANGETVHQA